MGYQAFAAFHDLLIEYRCRRCPVNKVGNDDTIGFKSGTTENGYLAAESNTAVENLCGINHTDDGGNSQAGPKAKPETGK
jgi:hypothetical protein